MVSPFRFLKHQFLKLAEDTAVRPTTCRAAFHGDVEELRRLLPGLTLRQKLQLDPQGNTVGMGGRASGFQGPCAH